MSIEVDYVTLPAHWASALVNGDFSGMDDDETARMALEVSELARSGFCVVDVARNADGEPQGSWFSWSFASYGGGCAGGDLCEYVVHRQV